MAVDGLFLHFLKDEIASFAVGAKVEKVYMPTRFEIVLIMRSRSGSRKLFISVGGNAPRVNFTSYVPENPASPPMLCMLFRKILTGAVLTGIRQQSLDRVLFLDFDASNEIGDRVKRTLVLEIMAQYSNCVLLDEQGRIIDAVKRVDATKNAYREILPQREYVLPPSQDKLSVLENGNEEILRRIASFPEKTLSSALMSVLMGASPWTAREIAYRVLLGDRSVKELTPSHLERLGQEFDELRGRLLSSQAEPCYLSGENGEFLEFSFMPLTLMSNSATLHRCDSLSDLLDAFYVEKEKSLRAKSQAEDLFRTVNQLIERTTRKVSVRREELPDDGKIEEKRICAELINVYLSSLPKGVTYYEVENYYDENRPLRIPASPELSPAKNAQKYYKDYKKAQTAKKVLKEQIEKGLAEYQYLLTVQDALGRAVTPGELNEIREELISTGFLKRKGNAKAQKVKALPPLEFTSPGGYRVLVGRNNLQNERISFKLARKNDVWFHVQKAPGSHVLLCLDGAPLSEEDGNYASGLAVWFSSVRERGAAEVDYTPAKNLKKPPASNPGFVIYHVYKTVYAKAVQP